MTYEQARDKAANESFNFHGGTALIHMSVEQCLKSCTKMGFDAGFEYAKVRILELESALAFYADKDNWDMDHMSPTIWDDGSIDLGNRARKAIEGAGRDEEGK